MSLLIRADDAQILNNLVKLTWCWKKNCDLPQITVICTDFHNRGGVWLQYEVCMKKVLIVDDTPLVRTWARAMLGDFCDYVIDEAQDGVEAMELFVSNQYALVLMDLNMPRMNGFECTAKIREKEKSRDNRIPVICMTTTANSEIKANCLKAGMDDYLDKDCTNKQFEIIISRWLFPSSDENERI